MKKEIIISIAMLERIIKNAKSERPKNPYLTDMIKIEQGDDDIMSATLLSSNDVAKKSEVVFNHWK